ncbi:hypothetical protein [Falsirhodobacter xinxiangensis]|uniref:hypothetical protein n=1 Tax=Falsirhodobacter xinxiangensis TaxID=2530049 RepID=UPI0010AB1026|nr:hypothetical protein [Rhodobacter xinxiangensis]
MGVTLDLTVGEVSTHTVFPDRRGAMDAVIDAFIANFPDEDEIFALDDPIDEDALRAFVSGLALDREFAFALADEIGKSATDSEQHRP